MKIPVQVGFCVVLLTLVGSGYSQSPVETSDTPISQAINAFGVEAYIQFAKEKGNIVFSPSSIHAALAMTYAGARGDTAQQMADVLHFGQGDEYLAAYGQFLKESKPKWNAKYELYTANALWPEKQYHFSFHFKDINRKYFDTALKPVDFKNNYEKARESINQWVEDKTKDRIQNLLPKGSLDSLTRLVLTNAIYFKGEWQQPFKKERTNEASFYLLDGRQKAVPMMNQEDRFAYSRTDDLQILKLPYKDGELSMIILLPIDRDGLPEIEKKLTPKTLTDWVGKIESPQQVEVSLPKFRVDYEPSLPPVFKELGMTDAFIRGKADFSGMDGTDMLYITGIFHKAFLQVDEKGTEAAAATAVVLGIRSAAPVRRTAVFTADHPFLFLVRQEKTGAILFLGRVVEP